MSNQDGGPAYPCDIVEGAPGGMSRTCVQHPGMTLLDYFAGQYLSGIMSCPIDGAVGTPEDVASEAYLHAKAMIAERGMI